VFGYVTDNVGVGIAIGVAIGVSFYAKRKKSSTDKKVKK